jgi:hypothetical protein
MICVRPSEIIYIYWELKEKTFVSQEGSLIFSLN